MVYLRKYGTGSGADVYIPVIKRDAVDFAVSGDWSPASGDVKISIDGGAAANIGTLPVINGTHDWKFVFADAELQGKTIRVRIVDSATKAVEDQSFTIETYGHASAMYQADLSAANLPANLIQIGGDSQSATDLKDFADAGYDPSTNKVQGVVLVDTLTTYTGNTPQTADHTANIAAILVDTGTTLDGKLDTIDNFLDTEVAAILAAVDTEVAAIKATTDKLDDTLEDDAGTYRFTTNSLEQAPTGGSAPTASEIADAVWDEDLTGHTTADTAGEILGNVATGTPPTAAAIADAVWDEATAGHTTSGTFGEQLKTDVDAILADTAEIGAAGAGLTAADDAILTAIAALNDLSSADVQSAASAAITAYDPPTNAEMEARTLAAASYATAASLATVDTVADAIKAKTDQFVFTTAGQVDATAITVSDKTGYSLSNTGIDALFTRQLTEAYNADGTAPTVAQSLFVIMQGLTEKAIAGTTVTVKKLDGSTTAYTLTLDDATTPTSSTRAS